MESALTIACVMQAEHVARYAFTLDGYRLYRCSVCRHVWVHPLPSEAELAAFYDQGYFMGDAAKRGYKNYDDDKQSVLSEFAYFLDALERITPADQRTLLDIGPATGVFLSLAKQRGWQGRGLELSAYAAGCAREKGLDVSVGAFERVADDYRGVQVITLWDVVEHLRDPRRVFERMAEIMPNQGVIMFATPQSDSLFARLTGRFWTLLAPPQHLHYFSRQSMEALLRACGFEVVSMEWRGKTFDAGYIIHFVMGWRKIRWAWLGRLADTRLMRSIRIRINPRDMMIVLARKKLASGNDHTRTTSPGPQAG